MLYLSPQSCLNPQTPTAPLSSQQASRESVYTACTCPPPSAGGRSSVRALRAVRAQSERSRSAERLSDSSSAPLLDLKATEAETLSEQGEHAEFRLSTLLTGDMWHSFYEMSRVRAEPMVLSDINTFIRSCFPSLFFVILLSVCGF